MEIPKYYVDPWTGCLFRSDDSPCEDVKKLPDVELRDRNLLTCQETSELRARLNVRCPVSVPV